MPQADVGRELGDALLHFAVPRTPVLWSGGACRFINQPIEFGIAQVPAIEPGRRHLP
jgi:hypothetical protein